MPASSTRRLVALDLPPGEEFAAALDAAWGRGDAVLPIDPRASDADRRRLLVAMAVDEPADDDVALVIATSGSTGEPKGAQLSAAALEASARGTAARIGDEPRDHWLACLPWHHIGGLQVLLRARLTGRPITVHDRFDVERVAAEHAATLTSLVPTQLVRLLDARVDLTRFRAILLGGAAAPPALLDRAAAAGANVVTTYGMSETAGGCVYDGVPLDGLQVRIEPDDGRVLLHGPMLMTGYRRRPDLTAETLVDGWLRTNDVGVVTGGRLVVHGRLDDAIVTGGEKVMPGPVAAVLALHPHVAEVAVVAAPDAEWGEQVAAVVVPSGAPPTLRELQTWAAGRLPSRALPRRLVVVAELPRLSSGKPDRAALRQLAQRGEAPPPGGGGSRM